jgi:tRNA pseudouridine55 synthase
MTAIARSGVLVVNKGSGITSFHVVAHLRRLLRVPKVGHGGTLDPEAIGVLPILINQATKLTPYLADHSKEYVATVRLGVTTDTQDLSGTVLTEAPVPPLTSTAIQEVLARFVGQIQQVPPMYSALHVKGRRLYELARRGVEVKREPRPVTIHALTLESLDLPNFTIRVVCGKGTYVRTLCADLGEALGCGGVLERLLRTRFGPYSLEMAVPWAEVVEARDGKALWERLLPPDSLVSHLPQVHFSPEAEQALIHGRSVPLPTHPRFQRGYPPPGSGLVRLYTSSGAFFGLGRLTGAGSAVKPERILHGDHPRPQFLPA